PPGGGKPRRLSPLRVANDQWQIDLHRRPPLRCTLDRDATAVGVDDFLGQSQAETQAARAEGEPARSVQHRVAGGTREGDEGVLQLIGAEADAVVLDEQTTRVIAL